MRSTLTRELQLAKLTAAINRAKDNGDIGRLREIADDPHGFILRQSLASRLAGEIEELGGGEGTRIG